MNASQFELLLEVPGMKQVRADKREKIGAAYLECIKAAQDKGKSFRCSRFVVLVGCSRQSSDSGRPHGPRASDRHAMIVANDNSVSQPLACSF
jgi:hypothetical protein